MPESRSGASGRGQAGMVAAAQSRRRSTAGPLRACAFPKASPHRSRPSCSYLGMGQVGEEGGREVLTAFKALLARRPPQDCQRTAEAASSALPAGPAAAARPSPACSPPSLARPTPTPQTTMVTDCQHPRSTRLRFTPRPCASSTSRRWRCCPPAPPPPPASCAEGKVGMYSGSRGRGRSTAAGRQVGGWVGANSGWVGGDGGGGGGGGAGVCVCVCVGGGGLHQEGASNRYGGGKACP